MNFMNDALTEARKVRAYNVIDDSNQEVLVINAGLSYPARAIVETIEQLKEEIGTPKYVKLNSSGR